VLQLNGKSVGATRVNWERFNELIALDQSGKTEEALSGLQDLACSATDPEDQASVLLTVSACQKELKRYDEARRTIAEARSLARRHSTVHPYALLRDASIDALEGNWKSALEKLDSIVQDYSSILHQPEHQDLQEEVTRYRGMALSSLGRKSEARPLLERATAVEYEKATSLYYLGRCCYDLGDLEKARESLEKALMLELDPVYQPSAHYVLGLTYHWRGQNARAIQEFEWCLEHDAQGLVAKWKVLTALVEASKALGLEKDVERYSKMLQRADRRGDLKLRA
jgi:tetratricopeptide (TPR) repeat protein